MLDAAAQLTAGRLDHSRVAFLGRMARNFAMLALGGDGTLP